MPTQYLGEVFHSSPFLFEKRNSTGVQGRKHLFLASSFFPLNPCRPVAYFPTSSTLVSDHLLSVFRLSITNISQSLRWFWRATLGIRSHFSWKYLRNLWVLSFRLQHCRSLYLLRRVSRGT